METLRVETHNGVTRVTLNRPDKRNAFDDVMIRELKDVFGDLGDETQLVVLTGAGSAFCAGADLAWMAKSREYTRERNVAEARSLGELFRVIDEAPRAVIARVNGPAMGGALGIIAACDVVVAVDSVHLAFSEVRLGLAPAVISPFVVRKIGRSAARRYFLTGETFNAQTAKEIGLVHEVVGAESLDERLEQIVSAMRANGPQAMGEAKALIRQVTALPSAEASEYAAEMIARLRVAPEAQEGLAAFLEKRPARWSDVGHGS